MAVSLLPSVLVVPSQRCSKIALVVVRASDVAMHARREGLLDGEVVEGSV